jgi:DNA-directed RNA polymerase specialized sigma24 family protein
LAQVAVEATSRTYRRRPIENIPGFIFLSFKRLCDKYLSRGSWVQSVDHLRLEDLANRQEACVSAAQRIEARVHLHELMAALDPETRDIFAARIAGYSVTEIAQQMGIDRNCLGMRYMRGLRRAEKRMSNKENN